MPVIPMVIAGVVVGSASLVVGDAADAVSRAIKWGTIAAGLFLAGRVAKVW